MAGPAQEAPTTPHDPTPGEEFNAPEENFSRGIFQADIPELGVPERGKVRDCWQTTICGEPNRVLVTTDRLSAYDRRICTVPGKGRVLNLLSAFWFDKIEEAGIIPTHRILVPGHDNVLIARQAVATLPVEVIVRRYMAESGTSTSVYYNYTEKGDREIYGYTFPDGLRANEELPFGTIITPTTKAVSGHDQMLSMLEAEFIVDGQFGEGTWEKVGRAALNVFGMSYAYCKEKGLILVDTKYEFGFDEQGQLMIIDEVNTPDSSRYWKRDTYQARFEAGKKPEIFDKEIIRASLKNQGFTGEGRVPLIPSELIEQVAQAYAVPYEMLTGKKLPLLEPNPATIRAAVLRYIEVTERKLNSPYVKLSG